MSFNTFGRLLRFTTWGESHGPALGAVVDGCPPGLTISESVIQPFLDARRPGQSKFTTQRQEPDAVRILSGVFEGKTTGTPISPLPGPPTKQGLLKPPQQQEDDVTAWQEVAAPRLRSGVWSRGGKNDLICS